MRRNRVKRFVGSILLVTAWTGAHALGQTAAPSADPRLDLFVRALRAPSTGSAVAPTTPQSKLEQLLAGFLPMTVGHGEGLPLVAGSQAATPTGSDPTVYGFCYEACRTERAVGSCGTPASGQAQPPTRLCSPIQFNSTLSAIIGPSLGTGASPFVDDNKGADLNQQPAGYTFLGQFIDHDVTRTQTALQALSTLNASAQSNANVRGKLAPAGITVDQLQQAIADAAAPT